MAFRPGTEPASETPAVSFQGVKKQFGQTQALDGLSFDIPRGIMAAIVGPDGAGKTTTLRTLAGILAPEEGALAVLGQDWKTARNLLKNSLGYLPQRFSLYGDLTVDENIAFFAELHGISGYRERRDQLLAFTRLEPFRNRPADKLSGGMKQKLGLACTLIHEPVLLLLDEPTTGVDPVSRREFHAILDELRGRGMSIVVATPYMDEAERCDLVILLHQGRCLDLGDPDRLRDAYEYAMYEVSGVDVLRAEEGAKVLPGVVSVQVFGDRIHVSVREQDDRIEARIIEAVRPYGPDPRARRIRAGIEDVFILRLAQGAAAAASAAASGALEEA